VRTLFGDSAYYIALLIAADALHEKAMELSRTLRARYVTTDPVIVEVLAYVAGRGTVARLSALRWLDELRADASVTIVRQAPDLFDAGLELYRRRPDKAYSLTDCMSMVICRDERIAGVLTHDRHFAQEGFTVLL